MATTKGLSKGTVPSRGCAYHDNATKYREQTKVEGTHSSVVVICRCIVALLESSTQRRNEVPKGSWRDIIQQSWRRKLKGCED